jgi:small subunit ribosomal protein S6
LNLYESTFIGRQELSTNQVNNIISNITEIIKKKPGSIIKTEYCGLIPLAYPIKKNRKGHYIIINIKCEDTVIKDIKNFFRLSEDIIRDLTLAVKKHSEESSMLYQQSKSFRESRNWNIKNND